MSRIKSFDRRTVKGTKTKKETYGHHGRIEMDTHADTCVLGQNFTVLHYTEHVCSVAPYSEQYEPIRDVPIVTGATAVQLPDGATVILVINQGLWMPDNMDHSLLNPNQLRCDGTQVQDNPFNEEGLYMLRDKITIPLETFGIIIGCNSWASR